MDEYAAKDSRVSVVHQANAGAGLARNVAINRSHGEFVAFMDGDDRYYDECALQALYDAARLRNVNVVGGLMYRDNGETLTSYFGQGSPEGLSAGEPGMKRYADYPVTHTFTRFLYRRQWLLTSALYFHGYARHQDAAFVVHALATAGEFLMLRVPVYICTRFVDWKPVLVRPMPIVGYWRFLLEGLSLVRQLTLTTFIDLMCANSMFKFLAYYHIARGNTTVAEVWERVVRTAKDEGFYTPQLFLTDLGDMRALVEDTVARCHELKRTLAAAKSVVVYGAGQVGQRAARFIRDCNPKLSLGFAVSAGQPHEATVMGLPVRAIDEVSPGDGTLIVLAVGEKLRPEMSANLRRLGLRSLQINHNLSPDIVRCVEILESEPC